LDRSLANEVGCHQSGITQGLHSPSKIFLCEVCDDTVAFELHKQASHYLKFNDAISGMVGIKPVGLLRKINY
jgi:quinol monooxygenase YgiN